jgi:hypothetical protein
MRNCRSLMVSTVQERFSKLKWSQEDKGGEMSPDGIFKPLGQVAA